MHTKAKQVQTQLVGINKQLVALVTQDLITEAMHSKTVTKQLTSIIKAQHYVVNALNTLDKVPALTQGLLGDDHGTG